MGEWLYEDGIGERRAVLIEQNRIVEAAVERDSDGVRVGAIVEAKWLGGADQLAVLPSGERLYLPAGSKKSVGAAIRVKILREAIPEASHVKRAVGSSTDLSVKAAPDLLSRITASWHDVRTVDAHGPDMLAEAGWAELMDEAASGIIPFEAGLLRVTLTPAMLVIDVDGAGHQLLRGAIATTARMVRKMGAGGNIVADMPTVGNAAERKSAVAILDALMKESGISFERTAINGFGLLQIIIPRLRPNLFERAQFAPVESAALALLRSAERARGAGPLTLSAHPAVTAWLEARPALTTELARRTGRPVVLQTDAARGMAAGHAQ